MLSKIKLSQFKSISNTEDIDLTDFTILCGSNSSGKSSLIQAVLMLSQTFGARHDQDTMVLNGHLVRLGAFSDIRTHNAERESIDVAFTINGPVTHYGLKNISKIVCKFNFGQGSTRNRVVYSESDFHPVINAMEVNLHTMVDGVEKTERLVLGVSGEQAIVKGSPDLNNYSLFDVKTCSISDMDEISKEFPGYRVLGCVRNAIIPHTLRIEYNHARKVSAKVIDLISNKSVPSRFLDNSETEKSEIILSLKFLRTLKSCIEKEYSDLTTTFEAELSHLSQQVTRQLGIFKLEEIKQQLTKAQLNIDPIIIDILMEQHPALTLHQWREFLNGLPEKAKKALTGLIDKHRSKLQAAWYEGVAEDIRTIEIPLKSVFYLANYLSTYFSRSIKYLGPLRSEPQSVYTSLGHTDPHYVGLKGEYTAAVLHINRNKIISFPSPIAKENEQFAFRIKEATLQEACREWLEYLGVVVEYRTRDRGKLGYEIYVKTHVGERWQDLTHVGVGVSQVLPIILMFLMSQANDFLIFEQPELHLHPKIQSRLCDFFTAMSSVKRKCLIETHSEYLITRLRLRIAQSRNSDLQNSASVFFVTKVGGASVFSSVEITKYGSIPDWPEDFFDQTDEEIQKLLIEAAQKRKDERKEGGNAVSSN